MPGELETLTRKMFGALDRNDAEAFIQNAADDVQAVDEISRRWLRGVREAGDYLRNLVKQIQGVHSTISNVREVVWGDAGPHLLARAGLHLRGDEAPRLRTDHCCIPAG